MRLLLDECVPRPLRRYLAEHEVYTVEQAGFKSLKNGALLAAASESFDVLVTVDRNLQHQQNIEKFKIAVLVISAPTNNLLDLLPLVPNALQALAVISGGTIVTIEKS